jgi:hypothetical protein
MDVPASDHSKDSSLEGRVARRRAGAFFAAVFLAGADAFLAGVALDFLAAVFFAGAVFFAARS